jgi:hypothetical protein
MSGGNPGKPAGGKVVAGDMMGGSGKAGSDDGMPKPVGDPEGFTTLTKSADTRVIYVSASGDDKNDGLSEDKPLKTPEAGLKKLRTGSPDWLLFKRGDTFDGSLGNWAVSGRSASEPIVVSAYGNGARPLFRTGGGTAIDSVNSSDGGPHHDHVWFIGLSFYANRRDPSSPDFGGNPSNVEGIHWRTGTTDLLIEDCVLRFYGLAGSFLDSDNLGMTNIRLRRNQFLDSYNTESQGHSQGIYLSAVKSILFEENIFDHNGWNDDVSGAQKQVFNHNLYGDNGNKGIVFKNNISMRASSHGAMIRPGGVATGNFFAYDAISLLIGGGDKPEAGGVDGEATDNVVLAGTDIGNSPKQYGIDLENIHSVKVANNIVANASSSNANPGLKTGVNGATYTDNIVYNWPVGTNTNGSFSEPKRDLASYDKDLGGPGTLEHFIEGLRSQSQQTWRTEYTAQAINDYFREGFQGK